MINKLARPSRIEIDIKALKHNISVIKSWIGPKSTLMGVVKADAYGHGAVKISQAASEEGVDFLGVAFLEEAIELQEAGINTPKVILYPESIERSIEAVKRNIFITISNTAQYTTIKNGLNGNSNSIRYFIKAETGMNRYGMKSDEIEQNIVLHINSPTKELYGITTNLADPGMNNKILAEKQVRNFVETVKHISENSSNGIFYSIDSSGSVWKNKSSNGSLVRIGHLLYGLVPNGSRSDELKPVMSVKSRIAEIHHVKEGDGVGYGFSFIARRNSIVATVPAGYADGYPWNLSNKGQVIVRGKKAPIAGKICMDAFMIDITDIPECQQGDDVILLGSMGDQRIDAHDIGSWAGTFSYEILSGWSKRMPRIYL